MQVINFYVLGGLLLALHALRFFGFGFGFLILAHNRKAQNKEGFLSRLFTLFSLPAWAALAILFVIPTLSKVTFYPQDDGSVPTLFPGWLDIGIFVISAALGIALAIMLLREGVQKFDVLRRKATVTSEAERNKKTDVRDVGKMLPQQINFNVEKYIDFSKGTFLGLGENGPVYWPAGEKLPHVQVAGTTGSGKGVFIGMFVTQNIGMGEAVFYIDPKDDEFAPHVVATAAKRFGKTYNFIDLRPTAGPQLNLFAGASKEQIEELFIAGFDLAETGGKGDFYRLADREAAEFIAAKAASIPGATPASLYAEFGEYLRKDLEAESFAKKLKEIAAIPSVNANDGLDLRKIVKDGGAVYVVGSMRNAKVMRLQKMLVIKLIHLAEERKRTSGNSLRPVSLVLDEFIYHISKPVLEGLGAARDKGVHVTLAHQANADFKRCGEDLNAEAVEGAVIENCKLKFVYKIEDPDTADWFAKKSGSIQVDDETKTVERNIALSETVDGRRSIRQAERFLIDSNMIQNLDYDGRKRLGVIYGLGLAQFAYSSPVKVEKDEKNLVSQIFEGSALDTGKSQFDISDEESSTTTSFDLPDGEQDKKGRVIETDGIDPDESETISFD